MLGHILVQLFHIRLSLAIEQFLSLLPERGQMFGVSLDFFVDFLKLLGVAATSFHTTRHKLIPFQMITLIIAGTKVENTRI